jgi:uncharacterized protein
METQDMNVNVKPDPAARPPRRRPPGVLLFLPSAINRTEVVQWLKRIHAWTGFWGALIFLVIGVSGFLLNHRAQLKIDTGEPVEVMSVVLPVDPGLITSQETLGTWAQTEFGLSIEPRAPRGGPPGPGGGEARGGPGGGRAEFMGQERQQAEVWKQAFSGPNGVLTVEYSPGSNTVKASKTSQSALTFLKNLHKGAGLGVVWVLFIDTIAGALVAMSLTGALLWSRLHGPRLAAIGIVTASLVVALCGIVPNLV